MPDLPLGTLEALVARETPAPDAAAAELELSPADRVRLAALAAHPDVLGVGQWALCEADRHFLAGVRVRLYKDLRRLARGGDGHVSVARFRPTGELRVHKLIPKPPGPSPDADRAARALRAVSCAVRPITDACPQIVFFFEAHDGPDAMHTFSELCEGDLQRYIAAHAPLGERTVARVLTLVLRAVATLHAHGIVHRDLKAPNIFLRDMGDPLSLAVGDLISSAVNPPGTVLGPADGLPDDATSLFSLEAALRTSCGTPLCLSPEVALGRPYGPKVDLWAAGILLYQLFCLRTPFEDSRSYLELYRRIPLADYSVPPGMIPPGAADLLSRLLDPDPGRRPSAAEAMRHPWLVAAAGHFEAPPRKARMGSVSSTDLSTTSAPSVGEPMVGRDAERAAAMMLSGAEVDFDFATGTLRVAGDGTIS